jgi:hypothetical protein
MPPICDPGIVEVSLQVSVVVFGEKCERERQAMRIGFGDLNRCNDSEDRIKHTIPGYSDRHVGLFVIDFWEDVACRHRQAQGITTNE